MLYPNHYHYIHYEDKFQFGHNVNQRLYSNFWVNAFTITQFNFEPFGIYKCDICMQEWYGTDLKVAEYRDKDGYKVEYNCPECSCNPELAFIAWCELAKNTKGTCG